MTTSESIVKKFQNVIRRGNKTKVDETTRNVFYIIEGNAATPDEALRKTAREIIDTTVKYCGGEGRIIVQKQLV